MRPSIDLVAYTENVDGEIRKMTCLHPGGGHGQSGSLGCLEVAQKRPVLF